MFLHGAGGTGNGSTRPGSMADTANARGYAVIGPNGLQRENTRFGPGWSFHPARPQQRDEMAFFRQIADDAATRFGIDRDQIILGGFSIGGSMASYIACQDPTAFTAYAPVGGSFCDLIRPNATVRSVFCTPTAGKTKRFPSKGVLLAAEPSYKAMFGMRWASGGKKTAVMVCGRIPLIHPALSGCGHGKNATLAQRSSSFCTRAVTASHAVGRRILSIGSKHCRRSNYSAAIPFSGAAKTAAKRRRSAIATRMICGAFKCSGVPS